MNGGSRIIDLRPGAGDSSSSESADVEPPVPESLPDFAEDRLQLDEEPDAARAARFGWVPIALGAAVSLGWLVTMLALSWRHLADTPPMGLTVFLAALCVPPALVGILLLLGLRTSRAEAARFAGTASAMRAEAAYLERTIAVLSRTIEDNRQRLAEQALAMTTLGENATARLGGIGSELGDEIARAEANAKSLSALSSDARANLETLIAMLPRAGEDTAGLTEQLKHTAIVASEGATALDAQLSALAECGREADHIAGGAAQKLAANLMRMKATSESAAARLEQVSEAMSVSVDSLLDRTAGAVDEARKGISAQGEAMLAMLGTNQAALDRAGKDSAEALATRIASIEKLIDRISARLAQQGDATSEVVEMLDTGVRHLSSEFDGFHNRHAARAQELAVSMDALRASAEGMSDSIRHGDQIATTTIATTERLLTALDSATREIDETIPAALVRLDDRILASRSAVGDAKPELLALVTAAESTHDAIEAIAVVVTSQRDEVEKLAGSLQDTLGASIEKAAALGASVEATVSQAHRFSEDAAPRLVDALLRMRETANAAAASAREALASVIPEAAAALETASSDAMQRAATATLDLHLTALGEAGEAAAEVAERISGRLLEQVATINRASAIAETRIEQARVEREKAEEDSFARRVSLLIEALNSASIDITKAFSTEVTDTAWAAYLRGDRGVFTRRAVRLLDSGEAREIARLYDEDERFRDHVNHYIHDFEAMLRAILAQRDGSPLGVTLLSSDMGKLYVALAQAIERLRN
ncbi:hypothetical protein BH10PSE15_BH10PSE15_06930 [soil metagenome]